jgi:hypothetical protein
MEVNMWKRLALVILFILQITMLGCKGLNPIEPLIQIGIMWKHGEASKYYATDQETIIKATKAVLTKFTLPILEEKRNGDTYYIRAGDDDRFKIKIESVKSNITKLSIRVNIMGDKPFAELIYRHVDQQSGVRQFATNAELNESLGN